MKPEAQIAESIRRLEHAAPRISGALTKLEEWGGLAYGRGGSSGRSTGINRPTENVACAIADMELRDKFALDHAQITEDLTVIDAATKRIAGTIDRTTILARDVVRPEAGCWPCSQVTDPVTHRPHEASFQSVRERRVRPSEQYGAKIPWCSFHVGFLDRYGIEPAPAIDLWHLEHLGQRVPYQLIRDHHPEQFSMAQSQQRGRLMGRHNLDLREASA